MYEDTTQLIQLYTFVCTIPTQSNINLRCKPPFKRILRHTWVEGVMLFYSYITIVYNRTSWTTQYALIVGRVSLFGLRCVGGLDGEWVDWTRVWKVGVMIMLCLCELCVWILCVDGRSRYMYIVSCRYMRILSAPSVQSCCTLSMSASYRVARGYDSPWTTWRCVNRLRTGFTCSKEQRQKWGVLRKRRHVCVRSGNRKYRTHDAMHPSCTALLIG